MSVFFFVLKTQDILTNKKNMLCYAVHVKKTIKYGSDKKEYDVKW